MVSPKEDIDCYEIDEQREVLDDLLDNANLRESFFLTGGTALSVFYLHHRFSRDLDLFTTVKRDLRDLGGWIKRKWGNGCITIEEDQRFMSFLLRGVKVDLAVDSFSETDKERPRVDLLNNRLTIDTLDNIVSNKLCAMASRTELKDYVDFFFILKTFGSMYDFSHIYERARLKDAIFDDPPTVAYQIESGISVIKQNPGLLPATRVPLDIKELVGFCEDIVDRIFRMAGPDPVNRVTPS